MRARTPHRLPWSLDGFLSGSRAGSIYGGPRQALGPPCDPAGPEPLSIIVRRFEKPDDGPQYVDVEGRPLTPQPDWDD